ncbi:hypothetical protein [Schlesneria sp.]|uniref:hypothetical protein n=1 Tax=Schlesneria sp. TaxID=2762018 RepID=UPI002EF173BE
MIEANNTTPITVQFKDCNVGWIEFFTVAGEVSVPIRASHIFDPFPDLIQWLHAILTGVQECSVHINQEGLYAEFLVRRLNGGTLLFRLQDRVDDLLPPETLSTDTRELLTTRVSRRQFVEAMYNAFRDFTRSSLYRKEEWERESVMDRFQTFLPALNHRELMKRLTKLTRFQMARLLYEIEYGPKPSGAPEEAAAMSQALKNLLDPGNPVISPEVYQEMLHWVLPDDYDQWGRKQKTPLLLEQLSDNISPWCGTKLAELVSPTIEHYLQHQELDDQV